MFTVTRAAPEDVLALAELFREMDDFYDVISPESVQTKADRINSVLFANPPQAYALLARDGSHLGGFAAYSFLWPAIQATKSLYLKELYVSKSHRRSGIGKMLMAQIFKIATENDCSRVEWTTDSDNTDAQRFYESLGFVSLPSKVFYRVAGCEALRAASRA
jgi:ribosomal protein S18 acetylase RimI-like enzyme